MIKFIIFLITLTIFSAPVYAEEKILGLLELGPLCWWECEGHDRDVPLYKERAQNKNPALTLKRKMFFPAPNEVNWESPYWPDNEEYGYEETGAMIYETADNWYKIKIKNNYFWVDKNHAGKFHAYPQILENKLTYLPNWDFMLRDKLSGATIEINHPLKGMESQDNEIAVNILDIIKYKKQWWLQIEILEKSPCTDNEEKSVKQGWVPAYSEDNQRTASFYSRGC